METKIRIYVKTPDGQPSSDSGLATSVLASVDVPVRELHDKLRELEEKYPECRFATQTLDPY